MPLGSSIEATYAVEKYVSNVLTRSRIEEALGPLTPVERTNPSDESDNFRFPGAPGVVGFISPVSRPFCGGCNRMRLTSDGRFHLCLLRDEDLDVRTAIRTAKTPGAAFAAARRVLTNAVLGKPTGHDLDRGLHTKGRRMHQIGG
jgi:GTP 3',8-cyclase